MNLKPRCVLFDLDGTLIDTAPELASVANQIRADHGLGALPTEQYNPEVSNGVGGILGVALGLDRAEVDPELVQRFLDLYTQRLGLLSKPFSGIPKVLDHLDAGGIVWGVVTNKIMRLAVPLLDSLGLLERAGCVIGGDSVDRPKPAPDPLLRACTQLGLQVSETVYLGDDFRDIQAGQSASIRCAVAGWGYIATGASPTTWGAETILGNPLDILDWIGLTRCCPTVKTSA